MSKHLSRFLKPFTIGLAGLALSALAIVGCARVASDTRGSETHFLDACQSTCDDGLDCLGGLCTRFCTNDGTCQALNALASCDLTSTQRTCQVLCRSDAECTSIATELGCNDGQCGKAIRAPAIDVDSSVVPSVPSADSDAAPNPSSTLLQDTATTAPGTPTASERVPCATMCLDGTQVTFEFPLRNIPEGPVQVILSDGSEDLDECELEVGANLTEGTCTSTGTLYFDSGCPFFDGCARGGRLIYNAPELLQITEAKLRLSDGRELQHRITLVGMGYPLCGMFCTGRAATVTAYACAELADGCHSVLGCGDFYDVRDNVTQCPSTDGEVRFAGAACGEPVIGVSGSAGKAIAFFEPEGTLGGWYAIDANGNESCAGGPLWECVDPTNIKSGVYNDYDVCVELPDADGGPEAGLPGI